MNAHPRRSILTISIVLILMAASMSVLVPKEASALQEGDYEYELTGVPAVAAITSYIGAGGAVIIPLTLGGHQTAIVRHNAFNNMPGDLVTSVLLPSSVLTVENYAFANCDQLSTVIIGSGVVSLGAEVFYNCHSLESITVKDSNTRYSSIDGVLYDKSLNELIKCPAAKAGEVIIPNSVTSIAWKAFDHCWYLQHLTIGSGVTAIGNYAFYQCKSLETLTFAPGIALGSIGIQAFMLCTSLIAVELPQGLRTIGDSAFSNCVSLSSVGISEGVETIERGAFLACVSLTEVSIPASVTSIAKDAFYNCANLTSIEVSEANLNYSSIDGVLYNKNASLLVQCPSGRSGAFVVPEDVKEIAGYAFAMNRGLTAVTMGAEVTIIGESSFFGCSNLTEVTLGRVVTIGPMAFASCWSLGSVLIPATVNEIGSLAFFDCQSLTNITFLGLLSPEIVGYEWVGNANLALRGHADANSNFPVPGSTFYGLTMGPNLETSEPKVDPKSGDDTTPLLLIIAALLAVIAFLMVLLVRKKQGRS